MTALRVRVARKITSFLSNRSTFGEIVANAAIQIHNSSNINMDTNGEAFFSSKIQSIMDTNSIIIDVGTNAGDFLGLFLKKKSGYQGQIVAIDPLSENLLGAQKRFKNHLGQIIWVEGAATNFDGYVDFYKHVDRGFSGGDSLKPMTNIGLQNESTKIAVNAIMLSTLVGRHFEADRLSKKKIFFCKIDVEGAELLVLEGAKALLESADGINIIQFEFGVSSRAFKTYFIDIYSYLKLYDFETFILFPKYLKRIQDPIFVDLNYPYGNFVAIKKSMVKKVETVIKIV